MDSEVMLAQGWTSQINSNQEFKGIVFSLIVSLSLAIAFLG
jgi:hypothetical protein